MITNTLPLLIDHAASLQPLIDTITPPVLLTPDVVALLLKSPYLTMYLDNLTPEIAATIANEFYSPLNLTSPSYLDTHFNPHCPRYPFLTVLWSLDAQIAYLLYTHKAPWMTDQWIVTNRKVLIFKAWAVLNANSSPWPPFKGRLDSYIKIISRWQELVPNPELIRVAAKAFKTHILPKDLRAWPMPFNGRRVIDSFTIKFPNPFPKHPRAEVVTNFFYGIYKEEKYKTAKIYHKPLKYESIFDFFKTLGEWPDSIEIMSKSKWPD